MTQTLTPLPLRSAIRVMEENAGPAQIHQLTLQEINRRVLEMDKFAATNPANREIGNDEKERYARNITFVRATAALGILEKLHLLEIFERQQWRLEYATLTDFATQAIGISKSQLHKRLDHARILRCFARHNISDCAPRGRMVEELAKVPDEHRVEAWNYATDIVKDDITPASAELALHDYCRDHGIRYGRREPNPSSNQPRPVVQKQAPDEKITDGKQELTESEKNALCGVLSSEALRMIEQIYQNRTPADVIACDVLAKLVAPKLTAEQRHISVDFVNLLKVKYPKMYHQIRCLFFAHLSQTINKLVTEVCEKKTNVEDADFFEKQRSQAILAEEVQR